MKNTKGFFLFVFLLFLSVLASDIIAQTTDFWIRTKGPEAGDMYAIAFKHPYIFVATRGAGVFRSEDNGESWIEVNNGLRGNPIATIEQLVVNSNTGRIFGSSWRGIHWSDDNGDSWSCADPGFGPLGGLVINPNKVLFAVAQERVILRSSDSGDTWQACYQSIAEHAVTAIEVLSTGTLLAAVRETDSALAELSIIRSIDGGNSWLEVFRSPSTFGDNSITVQKNCFAVDPTNGSVYVGVFREGVWKSTDDGMNWSPISPFGLQLDILSVSVHPLNGDLYVGSGGIWRKRGSDPWVQIFTDPHFPFWTAPYFIEFNPFNRNIFTGIVWGGGIFRSADEGYSWVQINKGIINSDIRALAIDANDQVFAGTVNSLMFRTNDYGETWTQLHSGLYPPGILAILIHPSSGKIFASAPYQGLYQSEDHGDTWTHIDTFPNGDWVYSLISDLSNGYIYAGTGQSGVFRSTDGGGSWEQFSLENNNPVVRCLVMDSEGSIYAGTETRGVFRSDDMGRNWVSVNDGIPEGYQVGALAVSPKGYIFAGTWGAGVYRTANKGESWIRPATTLEPVHVDYLAINLEGHIFAAYSLRRSNDDGVNWEGPEFWSGMPDESISTFAIDSKGYLWAGSAGQGVYRSAESTLSDPVTLINGLIDLVKSMNFKQGISNSLDAKLENAKEALDKAAEGYRIDAINKLQAFINECLAQRGKALSEGQADQLVENTRTIIRVLENPR